VSIEDLTRKPGSDKRPSKIAVIFRGPPGSGKTHIANLIKVRIS
jgi:replication-associated recombination protein RarA